MFLNDGVVISTAVLGNYFGSSTAKMGGAYLYTCAVLCLLFLLHMKSCFSMITPCWARNPHYHFSSRRQFIIVAVFQWVSKLHLSSWYEATEVNFVFQEGHCLFCGVHNEISSPHWSTQVRFMPLSQIAISNFLRWVLYSFTCLKL